MIYSKLNPYQPYVSESNFLLDTFTSSAPEAIADHTGEIGASWTQNDVAVPYTVDNDVLSQEAP